MTKIQSHDLQYKAITTTGTAPDLEVFIPREDYTSLVDQKLFLKVHDTCSGNVTINVNGGGAKDLFDTGNNAVDNIQAGSYIEIMYNGSDFTFLRFQDAQTATSQKVLNLTRTDATDHDVYSVSGVGISAYSEDDFFVVKIDNSNANGVSVINIDGIGEKYIYTPQGDNLKSDVLGVDNTYLLRYDTSLDAFTIMETGNVNVSNNYNDNFVDLKGYNTTSEAIAMGGGYGGGSMRTYDGTRYLYCDSDNDSSVYKYDTWNDTAIGSVVTGSGLQGGNVLYNGVLYSYSSGNDTVYSINPDTMAVINSVSVAAKGTFTSGITVDETNGYLYICNGSGFDVVNSSTMTNLGTHATSHGEPREPLYKDGYVYINCIINNSSTTTYFDKIDVSTNNIVSTITIGGGGVGMITPGDGFMYCACSQSDRIDKINIATFTLTASSGYIDRPGQIDFKGDDLYAPCWNANSIYTIDKDTMTITDSNNIGNAPTANIVVNNYLYMSDYSSGNIYKIGLGEITKPQSGYFRLYFKSDGKLYRMDDTGAEELIGTQT